MLTLLRSYKPVWSCNPKQNRSRISFNIHSSGTTASIWKTKVMRATFARSVEALLTELLVLLIFMCTNWTVQVSYSRCHTRLIYGRLWRRVDPDAC